MGLLVTAFLAVLTKTAASRFGLGIIKLPLQTADPKNSSQIEPYQLLLL